MRKSGRPVSQSSVISIGGRPLRDRVDPPLRNARVQLLIQAFFMMVYTYALTHILLFAIELPVKILPLIAVIVLTFSACFTFLRFKRLWLAVLVVLALIVVPALIWPDVKIFHSVSVWIYSLIDQVNDWFYTVFYQVQTPAIDYSGVSMLFACLISLFMFTWINLSAAPFAMGLVVSVAFGLGEYFNMGETGIEIIILYLAAMLVVLRFLAERKPAGSRYASLSEMTSRKMKLSPGEVSRRNWAAVIALILICFIVLSNAVLPTDFFHNQWLDDQIASMIGRKYGRGDQPIGYKEFSLREFGYYPLETRVGGTARPSEAPYLSIEADGRPLWLKGTAYREYTGQGWVSESMNPNWLFGHQANQEAQGKHIGVPHVNEEDFMNLTLRQTRISIRPTQDQQVVFQSGRPDHYACIADHGAFNAYFNMAGHMYLDGLVPEGGYTSAGQSFNTLHLQTSDDITRFNELYDIAYGKSQQLTREERARYLVLPDLQDLESHVINFDATLHRYIYKRVNAISDADIIALIRETLSTRMAYTLEAGSPAEGEEFVGWFLREGKGYCTFFATAVTVLAREAKIPARYVEGFLVPATGIGAPKRQVLTGLNAHAWTEVWLDGAGWIPVDATPAGTLDVMARSDFSSQQEQKIEEPPPTETPPEETEPSDTIVQTVPDPIPRESTHPTVTGRSASATWLLCFLPLVFYLLWRHYLYVIRHREKYIERKLSRWGTKKLVIRIVWDIFSLWELDGKKRGDHESIRSFILRVEIARYTMFPHELIRFIERALYAPEGTSILREDESLLTLLDFYREEEVHIRKTLDRKRWIIYRWLTSKRQPF